MNYNDAIMRYSFADVYGEYLCHHGIKGQKWGIRRFQNPDGTLTVTGKQRYYKDDKTLNEEGHKALAKESKKLARYEKGADRGKQVRKFLGGSVVNLAAGLAGEAAVPALLNPATVVPAAAAYGVSKGIQIVGATKALSGFTKMGPLGHGHAVKKYERQIERMKNEFGETTVSSLIDQTLEKRKQPKKK